MQAEGHAMISGTDIGDKLRAAIASAQGLMVKSEWEVSCAKAMPHLWLSDCEALVSHLKNPKDERLEMFAYRLILRHSNNVCGRTKKVRCTMTFQCHDAKTIRLTI